MNKGNLTNILSYFTFIFLSIGVSNAFSQKANPADINSHIHFGKELESSKDNRFQEILAEYDDFIRRNPTVIYAQISKCEFIDKAYYDEYEGYSLKWEEAEECREQLYLKHPDHPAVIIFKLENLYGEELGSFIEISMDSYDGNRTKWEEIQVSQLYDIAARYYKNDFNDRALRYALKAKSYNEELDNSLLLAELYQESGDLETSKTVLIEDLDLDSEAWELNQKGELLLELKEFDRAITVFERVREKDSSFVKNENLYKILLNTKEYSDARVYLVKDTIQEWTKTAGIQKLLEHDIKYSSPEEAIESYTRMQELSYYDDFFGIKRIKIFFKNPFKPISLIGLSHIFILYLFILILFVLPYIWIMPIYGVSQYFNLNFANAEQWNLKHFWGISFVYLVIQFLIAFLFFYQDFLNDWFNITYLHNEEVVGNSNEILYYSIFCLIGSFLFLNKNRLKYIFRSEWSLLKIIRIGFGFYIFNIILIRILGSFVDLSDTTTYISLLNAKQEIILLLQDKGFLLTVLVVAVLAPIYEEIIFRGIILNSVSKHLGFHTANVIQATLFGVIHYFLPLFPFYFVFGIITGYVARNTDGLLTGIIFHAINNFLVVVALYYLL